MSSSSLLAPSLPLALAAPALLAAAVLVAFATKARPALGLAALVASVPFAFYQTVGRTTFTLPKAALLGLIAGLFARHADLRPLAARPARPILIAGALVLAATILSGLQAAHREPVARETFKALEYLLAFAAVLVAARADWDERIVRVTLAATVTLVSILALAQASGRAPSAIAFASHAIPRVAGPLEGPNQLAGFLGLALPVLLAFALAREPLGIELAGLGLGAMALALTLSRAGLLAALLALGIVAVSSRPRRTLALLTLSAGITLGLVTLGLQGFAATHTLAGAFDLLLHFASLAEAQDPGQVGRRSELWSAAIALWRTHPFFGVGAGNFELDLGSAGIAGVRTHANSLYLQSLAEGGIVGLAATLALVTASVGSFARGPFREPLVLGALAASVGFALHQCVDLLVFYPKVGELWWILLALGVSRREAAAPQA
ncbi:MAG: O-antigen ligase family protein [Candidatus Baltobacteraceae bacterium]